MSYYEEIPNPSAEWTKIDFECAFYAVRERLERTTADRDRADQLLGEISARCAEAESALAAAREELGRANSRHTTYLDAIGEALEEVRERRANGEPAQPDYVEVRRLVAALRARADDAESVESVACDVWSQIGPGASTGWSWAQLVGTYPEIANNFREKIRAVLAVADGREP